MKMHTEASTRLSEMIADIRIAMLTTIDVHGHLHSRPMATLRAAFDGELWFFTSAKCAKASEVVRDAHVNIAYAKPEVERYVSVSGRASVVHDEAKMSELWNESLLAYFPGGHSDPDLSMLRVEIDDVQYWASPGNRAAPTPDNQAAKFNRGVLTGRALN